MLADRALDETMLGNLIYQVEMSRSDMKNLFRWLTRHASDDPEVVDTLATEHPPIAGGRSLAEAFANPHQFDAGRFKNSVPGNDTYAPFGVDHHQCPMGGLAIRLGMIFLKALACGYRVTALAPGPPTRGAHHWEPSPRFSVQLTPR